MKNFLETALKAGAAFLILRAVVWVLLAILLVSIIVMVIR